MSNEYLEPSYLEDKTKFAADAPRWARHLYGLTLHDAKDIELADTAEGTEYAFMPNFSEKEEFPELKGVKKAKILVPDNGMPIRAEIVEVYYGIWAMNGNKPYLTNVDHDTPEGAYACMLELQSFQEANPGARKFFFSEPWVAPMTDSERRYDPESKQLLPALPKITGKSLSL